MNLREAAEQALEALENLDEQELATGDMVWLGKEIGDLRVALAEPTSQESRHVEPVAWAIVGGGKFGKYELGNHFESEVQPNFKYWENRGYELIPLYPAPPKRKPLLIEGNEFLGDPPAPAKTWGEYFENVVTTSRLSGLRVSALANPVAHEFAGVKITEVRLPENMAMRFNGDVLVIERTRGNK